jgi:hypothetical protein
MMTKHKPKSKSISQVLSKSIDDLYYSCSLEFWLSIATVGITADWIFKFGTESLLITLAWTGVLGIYIFSTSRMANRLMRDLRSIQAPRHLSLWLAGLGFLTILFAINAMTDPAHALILTDSGETAIKNLLSGTSSTATTATTATATASATAIATNTSISAFGGTVINLIKVFFALAFIFGLYGSYQKYNERAELQEIVQGPVVLVVTVISIDGILALIFR